MSTTTSSTTTTNNNNSTSSSADSCENCSSNFTLFKRKKICNFCKQAFCQFCVTRSNFTTQQTPLNISNRNVNTNGNQQQQNQTNTSSISTFLSSSSTDRICNTCQQIIDPQTSTDDLMKFKLKHLRAFLSVADISTQTCKDKRDLAELAIRTRIKYQLNKSQQQNRSQSQTQPPPQSSSATNTQQPTSNHNASATSASTSINDGIANFMNNVQDFVNFNLNSVINPNNPVPAPAPPTNPNHSSSSSQSQQQHNPRNTIPRTTSSSNSSFIPTNVFNFIGEQIPTVLQQTLNNNLFSPFSNNANEPPSTSTSTSNSNINFQQPPHVNPTTTTSSTTTTTTTTTNNNSPHTSTTTTNQTGADHSNNNQQTSSVPKQNLKRRASLSDIKTLNDIDNLTIKQIKEILASNFVEYKGCCEKKELTEKLKRLYNSYLENKRLEMELNDNQTKSSGMGAASSSSNGGDETDLCKICMESIIDCVLLDCGHMCSCIKCGKQLAECPICRQNVVRVIRVFKS